MKLDARLLEILRAAIEQGSFSAAAVVLNMSQPAVSMAIRQLEDRLGEPVVSRDSKGVRPTQTGLILLRHAQALDQTLRTAAREIALSRQAVQGPLAIGGTTGALLAVVPPVLAAMVSDGEKRDISLIELRDESIDSALRRHEIDIAICSAQNSAQPADIEVTALFPEEFVLVARHNHWGPNGVRLAQTLDRLWIMPWADGATRRHLEALFVVADLPMPRNVLRCDALATIWAILRQTDAVALLPYGVLRDEIESNRLVAVPMNAGLPPRKLVIKSLRTLSGSEMAAQFIALARRLLANGT